MATKPHATLGEGQRVPDPKYQQTTDALVVIKALRSNDTPDDTPSHRPIENSFLWALLRDSVPVQKPT